MENYEVNSSTCVIKYKNEKSEILERDNSFFVNKTPKEIINYNCEYFGSSFSGRIKGSQNMLGMLYKLPIIVEENKELIFMPTISMKNKNCWWVNISNVESYKPKGDKVLVEFIGGQKCLMPISYFSFESQLFRATKLLLILKQRKQQIK